MKIAMLTNNYRPFLGGVPVSVERQADELTALGHDVTVFAPEYGNTEETDSAASHRIIRYHARRKTMDNGMVYPGIFPGKILKVFEEESFDCIHVHHPMFVGPCALYLGKKYDIPVIYTYHTRYEDYVHYIPWLRITDSSFAGKKKMVEWIKKKVIPSYIKWFANQCDLVLAPSAGMRQILRRYGVNTRTEVFPTGLTEEFFKPDAGRAEEIRRRYGKGKKHLFITVSRLEKEKNYGFLLRGIADIRHKMGDNFHVLIIGDGSQKSELKVRASILGIQDVVTFVGSVPNEDVKNFLCASDVFLFASESETQGIVLAEAMAAGCPVVAVHAVGSDDIVKSGENGFLTEEDEDAWADAAIRAAKAEGYEHLHAAALRTAGNYRSSTLAIYEEMLYNQCICGKRTRLWAWTGDGQNEEIYENEESRGKGTAVFVRWLSETAGTYGKD